MDAALQQLDDGRWYCPALDPTGRVSFSVELRIEQRALKRLLAARPDWSPEDLARHREICQQCPEDKYDADVDGCLLKTCGTTKDEAWAPLDDVLARKRCRHGHWPGKTGL